MLPELVTTWPGLPEPHEGSCPAEEALTLLARGTDRSTAVRLADFALDADACLAHARCLWRAVTVLLCAGELVSADARLRRLEGTCDGRAAELVAVLRAQHARLVGDLAGARKALAPLASAEASPFARRLAVPFLAEALVAAGEVADAEAVLAGDDSDRAPAARFTRPLLLAARGAVHLEAGRPREALEDFLACLRFPAAELSAHFAVMHCRGLAALAARAGGRAERAVDLAAREQEAALAWGSPAYVGWALYVRAIAGGPDGATGLLVDAIDLLEVAQARVVLAAAAHELGRRLARAGDVTAARRELERAGRWAGQIGHGRLAAKVQAASQDVAHVVPRSSLTTQEAKIAELARAGYSNKQIAEKLYLTVRTIEFHLSNVYRKLRISSRRELMDGTSRSQ
ncbi:LuxR C-terminal-related transcriptional regulator [Amycolatopsis mongoliensis]|uniref:LuxR C-terminal-related transcriptional regulator n=1 Tax=Amycolatopsis mongoliensis TaxID=715475 RepID=A0A9Y2JJ04_9PSEU|nr:LuxR family transcriptional regulator [Amycolatopsis sp. 4-36]WIX98178.1 LuxR C-terminal-related transcriptional regulator [Amycolatopsis sp. 4-36]